MRTLNHPFMGVLKLPHKTCPFFSTGVGLPIGRPIGKPIGSTALFTLSISASCTIGTDRNEKAERFHSSVGIPQVRNRNSDREKFSSWAFINKLFEF